MKKPLEIMGIIAILISIGLSGCNQNSNTLNPERNKFVGSWDNSNQSDSPWTLFSDSTWTHGLQTGTWDLKNGKFIVDSQSGISAVYTYVFSNNEKTLTLILSGQNDSEVYTKL